jgi:hypothetical protein
MSLRRRIVVGVTPTSDSGKSTIFRAICNLADVLTPAARKEKPTMRDAAKKHGSLIKFRQVCRVTQCGGDCTTR